MSDLFVLANLSCLIFVSLTSVARSLGVNIRKDIDFLCGLCTFYLAVNCTVWLVNYAWSL